MGIEVDSSGAQVLDYMFNTATTPNHANHYCFAVNVVKNLNIDADDMGVHEGAPSLESCDGIEPTIIGATPSSGFTHFAFEERNVCVLRVDTFGSFVGFVCHLISKID